MNTRRSALRTSRPPPPVSLYWHLRASSIAYAIASAIASAISAPPPMHSFLPRQLSTLPRQLSTRLVSLSLSSLGLAPTSSPGTSPPPPHVTSLASSRHSLDTPHSNPNQLFRATLLPLSSPGTSLSLFPLPSPPPPHVLVSFLRGTLSRHSSLSLQSNQVLIQSSLPCYSTSLFSGHVSLSLCCLFAAVSAPPPHPLVSFSSRHFFSPPLSAPPLGSLLSLHLNQFSRAIKYSAHLPLSSPPLIFFRPLEARFSLKEHLSLSLSQSTPIHSSVC